MNHEFNSLNLNLLRALKALLEESSVSKAAIVCDVTQSAMSVSLKKLRHHFKNPLLTKGDRESLTLTPFAIKLTEKVQNVIQQIEMLFTYEEKFEPYSCTRPIVIGISDYVGYVLLLPLLATLERLAPDIRMIQVAINHIEDINTFRRYNLDFAIGDFTHVPDTLMTTKLFDDHYVMVACKNHPLMQQDSINMEELIKYPLVIESQKRNLDENFILKQMKNQGYFPKVKLITPYTMLGLHALPGTQNITYIASKLAHTHLAQLGLAMRSIPYPRATYEAKLYWSSLNHDSKIHKWFRELLKQVSQELSSGF